jgi:hypothetical protein
LILGSFQIVLDQIKVKAGLTTVLDFSVVPVFSATFNVVLVEEVGGPDDGADLSRLIADHPVARNARRCPAPRRLFRRTLDGLMFRLTFFASSF